MTVTSDLLYWYYLSSPLLFLALSLPSSYLHSPLSPTSLLHYTHGLSLPLSPSFPQERSLANQEGDIQSMQSALAALQAELGTELLSQLDSSDQREVCALHQTSIIDTEYVLCSMLASFS